MEHGKPIIILDFGGQYAHLIARRVRQCGVYSEIKVAETPLQELEHAGGIILSGGPQSVYDPGSPQADPGIFELGIPVLGICYGMQWMARALGGEVSQGETKEYGKTVISKSGPGPGLESESDPSPSPDPNHPLLFDSCPDEFVAWMSHGDEVSSLPEGCAQLATSNACANVAFANTHKNFYAVQFHPEVVHTEHGQTILQNFVALCSADPWSIASYHEQIKSEILEQVGDRNVFMLVSGGVDSTVAFTLLNEVLGQDRVQGLLVDTGLMRKDEVVLIQEAFEPLGITNLHVEDASEEFFANLEGASEPEEKRKIIGDTFLEVQRRVSAELGLSESGPGPGPESESDPSPPARPKSALADEGGSPDPHWMLGQGTIYPDTIETGGTKHADTIKTHHNRVDAIQEMIAQGLVIEPLKDLYKDEVRELGEQLGLPHELVWRHPFPGPGLGVRILCLETSSQELIAHSAQLIAEDFETAVLPVQSVGVQGDGRTYRHAIALFGEYGSGPEPGPEFSLATSIPNAHPEFNRVLFCSSHSAPPEFISREAFCTRDRADLLREADAIVDEEMRKADLYASIWQFPVVLLPFGISDGGQSIVLRPIESQEAMTANAVHLPEDVLKAMTERILALDGIECVFLDLTNKPPGTIEWE